MDQNFVQQLVLKLFDWPVLAFVILLLLGIAFRGQLSEALKRGEISIAWGDGRNIKVSQLGGKLDEELDPIHDEIQGIKEAITAIESQIKSPDVPPVQPRNPPALSEQQEQTVKQRMVEALSSGKYKWRSVERLAVIGGVSEDQALYILREASPKVVLGMGKSGRRIARLASREK